MPDTSRFVLTAAIAFALLACREKAPPPADSVAVSPAPSSTTSGNDRLLLATAKIALPPAGNAPADLPDPNSMGARLVASYCAQCHPLPLPSMHSATDWPSVVRRMWLRSERLPATFAIRAPDMGERALLLNYLNANALQVSGGTLPPGPGRDQFATVCSRCHALPDPRVHSPQDWLAVITRMERNIERMNVTPITRDQIGLILEYLQRPPPP